MDSTIKSVTLALGEQAIDTELKLRALEDLLIKKEIVTEIELKALYSIVSERDFNKLKCDLAESLRAHIELELYEENYE